MSSRAAGPMGHSRDDDRDWCMATNPDVRELLDHLADELAREYLRLMKQAATGPHSATPGDDRQGG